MKSDGSLLIGDLEKELSFDEVDEWIESQKYSMISNFSHSADIPDRVKFEFTVTKSATEPGSRFITVRLAFRFWENKQS